MSNNEDDTIGNSVPFIVLAITILGLMLGVSWAIMGNDFWLYKVFAPKMEEARRKTFEESRSYNEGVVQELRQMQREYLFSTPDQKEALTSVILHQTADYDENKLPPDLKDFLHQLRQGAR